MSGGRITLAIYIAIGFIPVAFGPAPKTAEIAQYEAGPPLYGLMAPSTTSLPFHAVIKPQEQQGPQPATLTPVVMYGGMGGSLDEHKFRFAIIKRSEAPVEMRGGCWSACTLITAYIPKDRLCFAPGAFLAFHAPRTTWQPPYEIHQAAMWAMYMSYPTEIRQWIDRNGGLNKLTIQSFWTMYDRELWAMGYPRCK